MTTPTPTAISSQDLPTMTIAIRSKAGVEFLRSPFPETLPSSSEPFSPFLECGEHNIVYSADGALLCIPTASEVRLYSTTSFPPSLLLSLPRPSVSHVAFSPLNSFLITYERKTAQGGENLLLWSTSTGERIRGWFQSKEVNADQWPVQWTMDEAILAVQVSNELQIYRGDQPTQVVQRFSLPGLTQFSISPSRAPPHHFAAFTPAKTTGPARITIHALPSIDSLASPSFSSSSSLLSPPALLSRSIYKAEEMSIKWSSHGLHCLCETSTSTDQSGRSYYGESHLHLFSLCASPPFTVSVDFGGNEGPMQDFDFHPIKEEFIVVQGYQPAVCTQYSIQGEQAIPVKQYGKAPRNMIRCSPSGRFMLLGGFGNLAGEMDLFDTLQFKKIGQAQDRDGVKSVQFMPDSRWLVLAVLRPWRRVENGFKLFSYGGELRLHKKYDELYQVAVQPIRDAEKIFPNRPASPGLKERRKLAATAAATPSPSSSSSPSPTGSYIPPHLRGRQGADAVNVVSAMIKGDKGSEGHKKIVPGAIVNKTQLLSQQQQPKEKVREPLEWGRKKKEGGVEEEKDQTRGNGKGKGKKKHIPEIEKEGTTSETSSEVPSTSPPDLSTLALDACEKRLKAATKKSKQIADLVVRMQGGQLLDEGQKAKLASQAEVDEEMEKLRQRIEELKATG